MTKLSVQSFPSHCEEAQRADAAIFRQFVTIESQLVPIIGSLRLPRPFGARNDKFVSAVLVLSLRGGRSPTWQSQGSGDQDRRCLQRATKGLPYRSDELQIALLAPRQVALRFPVKCLQIISCRVWCFRRISENWFLHLLSYIPVVNCKTITIVTLEENSHG